MGSNTPHRRVAMTYLTDIQDIRDENHNPHSKLVMFEQVRNPSEIAILMAKSNPDINLSEGHEHLIEDIKVQSKAHNHVRRNAVKNAIEDVKLNLGDYVLKGVNLASIPRQRGNVSVTEEKKKWMGNFLFAGNNQ